MSFLLNENNNGRRRVSQVSNDEWRAALQQQIEEKKQREQQQKRFRSFEDAHPPPQYQEQQQQQFNASQLQYYEGHEAGYEQHSSNAWDAHDSRDPQSQQQMAGDQSSTMMTRPGRRGVQQMSNDAWREALEQQIREKKECEQQQSGGGAHRRRSQSAPGQDYEGSFAGLEPQLQQQQMDQERAMTTPSVGNNNSNNADLHASSHGRRRVGMQTQEEFAKSLQEQLEVQKRFEQEALEFKRAQRQLRRKILINDEPESKDATVSVIPEPVSTAKAIEARHNSGGDAEPIRSPKQAKFVEAAPPEHVESEPHTSDPSNQIEERGYVTSEPKMAAGGNALAADPVALAKIVDFCEELKRQNEEVKQQLVEQHSVLASLRSSLVEAKAQSKDTKQPGATAKAVAASVKQTSAGVMKSRQGAYATAQQRKSASPQAHAEEKTKKKMGAKHHESGKCTEKAVKIVDAVARPPVVRSRPGRGESKIPFPSGVADTMAKPGSVDLKALEIAESKDGSELAEQTKSLVAGEALKDTAPSVEETALETEDAHPTDSRERMSSELAFEDGKNGEGEMDALNEEVDLRDDKEHAPAKPHHTLDTEDEVEGEEGAGMKPQVNRSESKLNQPEEHEDDADEELQLIHSDSFLIIEAEEELLDVDGELPMGCESKLLNCEGSSLHGGDEGEIKNCSSFLLVDGVSSLVALDQSLGDLFYR